VNGGTPGSTLEAIQRRLVQRCDLDLLYSYADLSAPSPDVIDFTRPRLSLDRLALYLSRVYQQLHHFFRKTTGPSMFCAIIT